MRRTEDSAPSLDYVQYDGLGFEQVVACVEIKSGRVDAAESNTSPLGADHDLTLTIVQYLAVTLRGNPEGRDDLRLNQRRSVTV